MSTEQNERIVREFFAKMGPTLDDFKNTYRTMLAADAVWESVGGTPRRGVDECVTHLDELFEETGMVKCDIDILHLAAQGDVVLTERVDTMVRGDGSKILDFRVMGAMVIRDGKIARYSDYLDTAGAARGLGRG